MSGLHRFAIFTACLTLVLLMAGALVTSNEAGDSVPDWPLSFGRWLINSDYFRANVRYEYSHRFIAGIVGGATLILAVWTWVADRRRWMRWLAAVAFGGVAAQAAIGGLRVLLPGYKPLIAVPHALIAQSFFAVLVSIAVFTSRRWQTDREVKPDLGRPSLRRLAAATVAAVLVQLVLGAGFRHQAFGITPHIIGAIVVAALVFWTSMATLTRHAQENYLTRPAQTALCLVIIQLCLGVVTYVARLRSMGDPQPLEPMISLTVAHLVVGALTLAAMVMLTLRTYQALAPARGTAAAPAGPKVIVSSEGSVTA